MTARALDQAHHTEAGVLKGAAQIVESARPTALEAIAEAEPASTPPPLSSDKRLAALDLWRHFDDRGTGTTASSDANGLSLPQTGYARSKGTKNFTTCCCN